MSSQTSVAQLAAKSECCLLAPSLTAFVHVPRSFPLSPAFRSTKRAGGPPLNQRTPTRHVPSSQCGLGGAPGPAFPARSKAFRVMSRAWPTFVVSREQLIRRHSPRQCSLFGRVLSRLLPRCSAYCDDLPDINTSPLDSGHTAQVILLQLDNRRERYESYFERYYSQRVTKSSSPQPHLSSETNTRALCHSSCQSKARRFSFANHRIAREQVITICS